MTDNTSKSDICSPLTGGTDISLIMEFSCADLVAKYKKIFNIDISNLTLNHLSLALYKCNESGFRFYYPTDIVGDSDFYHQLEANDWYYMPNKWEFHEALKFISPAASVLEIGSAKGSFLLKVMHNIHQVSCTGLELNKDAVCFAQSAGVNVLHESTAEHARNHRGAYNVVAAFQVLEHIPNPMQVLKDSLTMLKSGGYLIIGVPDNSTRSAKSIFVDTDDILNMPPHHYGLWDIPSLSFLVTILPIKLEHLIVEPATARHHTNNYRSLMKSDLICRLGHVFGHIAYLLARPFYNHALKHLNQYLPAHSVLAVYKKI